MDNWGLVRQRATSQQRSKNQILRKSWEMVVLFLGGLLFKKWNWNLNQGTRGFGDDRRWNKSSLGRGVAPFKGSQVLVVSGIPGSRPTMDALFGVFQDVSRISHGFFGLMVPTWFTWDDKQFGWSFWNMLTFYTPTQFGSLKFWTFLGWHSESQFIGQNPTRLDDWMGV